MENITMRKTKSNSTDAVIRAINNAKAGPRQPPAHLHMRDCDRPFWGPIIASRSHDEWTDVSLVLAVQLARCQADIERENLLLGDEGTVTGDKINPRCNVIEFLVKREAALMRALRMAGTSLGKMVTFENQRRLERSVADFSDDELLA